MTDSNVTYTFEGDEIFAIHEGQVIASGTDMSKVEGDAVKYLDSLTSTRKEAATKEAKKKATHIITPNGVKGEILGRTPGLWGDQITARFENGRIATFTTRGESDVEWVNEKVASYTDPTEHLSSRLEADYDRNSPALRARIEELKEVAREAHRLAANGAPYNVSVKLDHIKVAAETEARTVKEALDYLDSADAEAFTPPVPQVVEQAELGRSDNSWLDVTTQEMIDESEAYDYDKLLSEGPALFVTDLEVPALADTGVTRDLAVAHITSKTAGFQGEEIEDYRQKFVARVEVARRHELAARKENTKKEAAVEKEAQSNAPDEALFM